MVRLEWRVAPDITALARLDAANARPADYDLLPLLDVDARPAGGAFPPSAASR